MPRQKTREELLDRIDELEAENETLQDQVDSIAEIIQGEEAVPASDRYAFAAMTFECLTGTVVYPRGTEAAVLYAHTSEPPPRASSRRRALPEALDEVFAKAP